MKKVFIMLLCLLLLFALTLTVCAAGSSVALQASTKNVQSGEAFAGEAVLDNTQAVTMGTVALSYDENVFELTGGTCHVQGAMVGQVIPNKKAGAFLLTLPKKLSGNMFTFEFRVKDGAPQGTYEITAKAAVGTTGGNYIDVKGAEITVGSILSPEVDPTRQPAAKPEQKPTVTQPPAQDESQTVTLPAQTEDAPETATPTGENTGEKATDIRWPAVIVVLLAVSGIVAGYLILRKRKK